MNENIIKDEPFSVDPKLPARDRLIAAGASIFSDKGYGGASVRQICALAGTSSNMIHHYFGSKQGLYDEILSEFSERVLRTPIRIISEPPRNHENLVARLELFIEETLEALTAQPDIYRLVVRERIVFDAFESYNKQLVRFLKAGQEAGIVRKELNPEMLTGMILDRLGNQVFFASWIKDTGGEDILTAGAYRKNWLSANIDMFLHGILTAP